MGKIGIRSTLRSWKIITRNGVIKHGSEIPELRALKWNNPAHWRILQQYLMTPGRNNHIPSGKRLHSCGKSPFSMGKSTISTGSFSIAMLVYQRVACQSVFVETNKVMIKVMMIEAEIGGVSVIPIV